MNIQEVIETRKSIRKYKSEEIDSLLIAQVQTELNSCTPVFSKARTRFQVINNKDEKIKIGFLFGLGKVNAPCCIAGICDNSSEGMLEIGFALEQAVLKLTGMGYATCWLGMFDEQAIAQMCSLKGNEKVGIVVAVGHAEDNSFINNGFRKIAGSTHRKSFDEICLNSQRGDIDDKVRKMISLSILSPSANNQQPVRVSAWHNRTDFYLLGDNTIDAGIFLSHFYLSAAELYHEVKIIAEAPSRSDIPDNYTYIASILYN